MSSARNVFGSPGLRLVQLYVLLCSNHRRYSLTRLAEIFHCSRQSILRMMEQLDRVPNANIHSNIEKGERYYQAQAGAPPAFASLDTDSLRHLMLCRDIVQNILPEPLQREIGQTLGAAAAAAGAADTVTGIESYAQPLGKGTIDYTPCQGYLEDLQEAMRERRLCRIAYKSPSTRRTKAYYLAPARILVNREALYIHGRAFQDKKAACLIGPRNFALHRLQGVKLMPQTFAPWTDTGNGGPEHYGFDFDEPFTVRARFHGRAASYVAERTWSAHQKITRHGPRALELTFTSTSRPEVISWILSFGPDAELIEPVDLRENIKLAIATMKKIYGAIT